MLESNAYYCAAYALLSRKINLLPGDDGVYHYGLSLCVYSISHTPGSDVSMQTQHENTLHCIFHQMTQLCCYEKEGRAEYSIELSLTLGTFFSNFVG